MVNWKRGCKKVRCGSYPLTSLITAVIALCIMVLQTPGRLASDEPAQTPPKLLLTAAETIVANMRAEELWERGQQLEKALSNRVPGTPFDEKKFLGKEVVLLGGCVPPGSLPDLKTYGGVYIRISSKEDTDLRPHAVTWTSLVVGKVIAIHPENRIVVLEISDKDCYIVLLTT